MKFTNKKVTKTFPFLLIFTTIFVIIFFLFYPLQKAFAKEKSSSVFAKKYQTLSVNKKVQYEIKNKKNSDFVRFSISNSSLAFIHKKTGLLTTKKPGKVTITAKIFNKKQQNIKTLHDTVYIIKKKNILPNAIFRIKENINPWNFTLTLSCSRILLKNEISSDTLTILPKGKSAPKLTASFSKLSSDGKEITYTLSSSSQKKLCPGDFSMDGNYILESTCFSKKLSFTYYERLTKNTLSGFVLKEDGNPIKNALLSLKRTGLPDLTCFSDTNGHYTFQNAFNSTSLTVEKDGYQKRMINNPAISSEGTTCENIILRSSWDTSAAINFLVTDIEDNPISNALISILSTKKTTDSINNTPKNTDSYIDKNDILYSGATDSTGTLLLTNSNALPAAPCSILTLDQNASLSYSSSAQLFSTNTTILPSSILNSTDNYTIYVSKFSPDNVSSAYQTQKLEFSFCNLITNQATIHIRLEKCQNIKIDNLILNYTNSLSDCCLISLSFYHPKQKKSFYQYIISREQFTNNDTKEFYSQNSLSIADCTIHLSSSLPLTIPDDRYYFSITILSKENTTIAASAIVPITIQNSSLLSDPITLHQPRFARVLAYSEANVNVLSDNSFLLYQKCDNYYFLIHTFYAKNITKNNNYYTTASILLSHLLPEQNYLLLCKNKSLFINHFTCFFTTELNIYLTKNNAEYSSVPISKIQCLSADNKENSSIPLDFSSDHIPISYHICHTITEEFIRSSKTYPNCVMAFYQRNGTLLSLNLMIPPANQEVIHSSNRSNSIIDIYTNKEILITNQDSYS